MVQLTDKSHWAVEVPESWETAELHFQPSIEDMLNDRDGFSELIMWYTSKKCGSPRQKLAIKLPFTGTWQFLFTTKEATEEQARQVVHSSTWYWPEKHIRFVDYNFPFDHDNKQRWSEGFATAKESLPTLLISKGLDPNKNYAIIQNTNNGNTTK